MSKLDELIKEFCPNGVEYKLLSDITIKFTDGMHTLPKDIRTIGDYPILSAQNVNNGEIDLCTTKYVMDDIFQKENKRTDIRKGDVLLTIVGAIGRVAVVKDNLRALFQRSVCVIKPDKNVIIPEYLGYTLKATVIQSYMQVNAHGAAQKGLYLDQVGKLRFPVPPLEVQREIVHILDSFTLLTAELTAELTARRKQYEYYRNKLLSFDTKVASVVELRSVVKKSCSGATPAKGNSDYYEGGTIPWLRTQDVRFNEIYQVDSYITELAVAETGVKWISENCVIVAISGATAGRCAINKFRTTTNQHCLKFDELIAKKQGARGDLNSSLVLGLRIPLPSLEVQNKIVNVLDNFDTICSDLNIGLPAEIEARQKQYEYYRDKLLTFKELSE